MKIKEIYDYGRKNLPDCAESTIFCEEFFGLSRSNIIMNPNKEIENCDCFFDAVERRKQGEPLQYILGYWYFNGLKLKVTHGVLVPREDSEVLVNCAVEYVKNNSNKELKVVDLCSGTGAIALGISSLCDNVKIDAVELFPNPFTCLCENVETYAKGKVFPKNANIFTEFENYKDLDIIVSNPPYIESREIETLQIEVQNEPHEALDGGSDGLDFYKNICQNWKNSLKKGGLLAVEIGDTQTEDVTKLFVENGFINVEMLRDLNELPRVVYGIKGD